MNNEPSNLPHETSMNLHNAIGAIPPSPETCPTCKGEWSKFCSACMDGKYIPSTKPEPDFEKKLQEQLDELPYVKHLDDGQYNDGKCAGFEIGARWCEENFVLPLQEENKKTKIELSNYAYQMDLAKRERNQAEERTMKAESEITTLKSERDMTLKMLGEAQSRIEEDKNKILESVKEEWIKQFGSLNDDNERNGYFVIGFLNSVFKNDKH